MGRKKTLSEAFYAMKRLSVAQTPSGKVPWNGPETLLNLNTAATRGYKLFTAQIGITLLAQSEASQIFLSNFATDIFID